MGAKFISTRDSVYETSVDPQTLMMVFNERFGERRTSEASWERFGIPRRYACLIDGRIVKIGFRNRLAALLVPTLNVHVEALPSGGSLVVARRTPVSWAEVKAGSVSLGVSFCMLIVIWMLTDGFPLGEDVVGTGILILICVLGAYCGYRHAMLNAGEELTSLLAEVVDVANHNQARNNDTARTVSEGS